MNVHAAATDTAVATREVLGVRVAVLSGDDAAGLISRRIAQRQFTKVAFLNAHCANLAVTDPAYRRVLSDFLVLADGIGVDYASRYRYGQPFPENLNGTDFIPALLRGIETPIKVGLIGARPTVAERAAANLARMAPQHRIEVIADGFFRPEEEPAILDRLAALRPDILLVAMGVPRQENWIASRLGPRHTSVPIGVGALFDFLSGAVPRAPALMRHLRLEWLYRLIVEPRRLWRRYLIGNPLFLARVIAGGRVKS